MSKAVKLSKLGNNLKAISSFGEGQTSPSGLEFGDWFNSLVTGKEEASQEATMKVFGKQLKLRAEATNLLGSITAADNWVNEAIPNLKDLTPLQLIETEEGAAALSDYMNQIRYGVYI
jgi:hypothetical protein